MLNVMVNAPPDCDRCRGVGLVRPAEGGCGWVNCPACRGSKRQAVAPPFSVDWLSHDDDESAEPMGVCPLESGIWDRETATALAVRYARELGPEYAGGLVIVSDVRGVRSLVLSRRPAYEPKAVTR